jgi:predicted kinase
MERIVTHLFCLAGPPAVGKSTTARALAARFEKSIHIPVDDLRGMVVSGLVLPSGDWSSELVEQLTLARQTVVEMALIYHEAGYTVVIDDFWDPNSRLREYDRLFTEAYAHKIILLPNQAAAISRNIQRSHSDEGNEYIEAGIRLVYRHLDNEAADLIKEGWQVVDTTDKIINDTVDHIMGLIQ